MAWAATLADEDEVGQEIALIRRRLADLDAERVELERALVTFEKRLTSTGRSDERSLFADAPVTNNSLLISAES